MCTAVQPPMLAGCFDWGKPQVFLLSVANLQEVQISEELTQGETLGDKSGVTKAISRPVCPDPRSLSSTLENEGSTSSFFIILTKS